MIIFLDYPKEESDPTSYEGEWERLKSEADFDDAEREIRAKKRRWKIKQVKTGRDVEFPHWAYEGEE